MTMPSRVGEKVSKRVVFECANCDDYELEKSYSGRAGTPGKEEYDRIQAPDECPVCGGRVESQEYTDEDGGGDV